MKLASLIASSFLWAGISAAPSAKDDKIDPHHGYVSHAGHKCTIEGASEVKCRSGPGTDFSVVTTLKEGFTGTFTCVQKGETVTIDGFPNSGWDRIYYLGVPCYVSGQYTDSECGVSKLGFCEGG
ncbi:hypothetical protein P885DRAFT_77814 [Corynascus similis CBS 632.67]